jgi:hypothetical protein
MINVRVILQLISLSVDDVQFMLGEPAALLMRGWNGLITEGLAVNILDTRPHFHKSGFPRLVAGSMKRDS